MNKAKSLMMTAMAVMCVGMATSGYAASHESNVAAAMAIQDGWRDMVKSYRNTVTPEVLP